MCRRAIVVFKMEAECMQRRSSESKAATDDSQIPEASKDNEWIKSSMTYALSVFNNYIADKHFQEPSGNPKALAKILKNFYVDIRCKKTGNLFSKNSMSALRFGLKRYYKRVHGFDIISDEAFAEANRKFRGQMAYLKEKGLENPDPKRPIAPEDMAKVYRSGVFNTDRPDTLQNKVFFEIMLFFPHRGRYTFKELKKSDFSVSTDSSGRKYLAMLKSGQVEGTIFAQGGPSCPVASFEKYLQHLNPASEFFFQRPKRNMWSLEECNAVPVWYDDLPVGVNTLSNKMRVISQLARLPTVYTNSSITMSKHKVAVVQPGIGMSSVKSIVQNQNRAQKALDNVDGKWPPISEEDMKKLYWSGVFDPENPQGLQDKVFFEIMLFLFRPSQKTLRQLRKDDFAIGTDDDGKKYVYKKTDNDGGGTEPPGKRRKSGDGEARMYAESGPGCPVATFEKYYLHLNPACESFFQWPRKIIRPGDEVWYEIESVGENRLRRKMKDISQKALLSKVYTNHSIIVSRYRLKTKIHVAETSQAALADTTIPCSYSNVLQNSKSVVEVDHDVTSINSHVSDESKVNTNHDAMNNLKKIQSSGDHCATMSLNQTPSVVKTTHDAVNKITQGPTDVIVTGSERTTVKTATVKRRNGEFGFNVISSAPVIVQKVDDDGPAKEAGIQVGDIIVGVNGETVVQRDHQYVVTLIRSAQERVVIQIATPHFLKNFVTHCSPQSGNLSVALADDSTAPVEAPSLVPRTGEHHPVSPTF